MPDSTPFAVIMAGGSGTRFWPASRRLLPKQFLSITGGNSMIAATVDRLEGLVPIERILVVTGADHVALVQAALPGLPAANILAEPVGRNTLPCIALAAFEIERRDPNAIQIVLPADHVIEPIPDFQAGLRAACALATQSTALVTFGIEPTFPATGYGYIEKSERLPDSGDKEVHRVKRFVEKPDEARAIEYLATGQFLWNSGIFVWSTKSILRELREHAPQTAKALETASPTDLGEIYAGLESAPVDTAIMERAAEVAVLPINYTWNDVGSWTALPDVLPADEQGNVSSGGTRLIAEDATDCIVHGEPGSVTALIGVKDLVIVHAAGATLVCRKDRAQDVKLIVERLRKEAPDQI